MALIHGGDAETFRLAYGCEPLDFSANTSPLGVPEAVAQAVRAAAQGIDAYPDPLCRRLSQAIAGHENVPASWVLCGNGAADLIWRIPLALRPRRALVTAPGFAEYEAALCTSGCEVIRHPLCAGEGFALTERFIDSLTGDVQLVFLCNPNNPTGLTIPPGLLRKIAAACRERHIDLVVDECFNGFLDVPEEHTLKGYLHEFPRLILLKAFTKLYGMAGVRLGYCLCADGALLAKMQSAGQPWAVSSLAQAAGLAALREQSYVAQARQLVLGERALFKRELASLGMDVLGGEANYLFFHTDIKDLGDRLEAKGILIRDCGNYPGLQRGYYRTAVRTHAENMRLIRAIQECIKEAAKEAAWQNR